MTIWASIPSYHVAADVWRRIMYSPPPYVSGPLSGFHVPSEIFGLRPGVIHRACVIGSRRVWVRAGKSLATAKSSASTGEGLSRVQSNVQNPPALRDTNWLPERTPGSHHVIAPMKSE